MARQGKLNFVGTEENVIYYERLGGYFMRTKPEKVDQSEPTKQRAGQFGVASKIAKRCRNLFSELIPNPKDKAMQNRLNSLFYDWVLSDYGQKIPEFHFYSGNKQPSLLAVKPFVDKKNDRTIWLTIPAFNPQRDIRNATTSNSLIMRIGIAWISDNAEQDCVQNIERKISYADGFKEEEAVQLIIPGNNIKYLIIAIRINPTDNPNNPILAAITSGITFI